eukprot:jgi/Tetstr1/447705/TSEL_035062.t1
MRDVKGVTRGTGTSDVERSYARMLCLQNRLTLIRAKMDPDFQDLPGLRTGRYGHRRACVAAGGRGTRDEGVIREGDPGDFYMKVIAKMFRGVWHYGVTTSVVTEWVLEIYGGATQWRAVFEDGDTMDLLRSEAMTSPVNPKRRAGKGEGGGDAAGAGWTSDEEEEEEAAHLRAWESAAVPGSDTNALTFAVMTCSTHVKSKNFNNSADSDWRLLHDIMPAGFTWGGMAVPRSHKAMRKFLRVPDTSRYVRHMCPKGCVAFSGAPGKAGGWANLPDQHCPECNADRVPGGGGGSGGEEALVLLDGPGIRKVAVLMAPAHMSCANAADSGVDAGELLVAGIHARSQDVRAKCKCKLQVAGIHARSQDGASSSPGRASAVASAVADAVVAGCCEEVALDIASAGLGVCRRQSCEAMDTTSPPGRKWAASLVVSRVRAAGIEEDEKDIRKRVTRFVRERRKAHLNAKASTVPAAQLVVAEEAASSAA